MYYTVRDYSLLAELQCPIPAQTPASMPPNTEELVKVKSILSRDPIEADMTDKEKELVVRAREYLKEIPNTLVYYLQAVKW